MNLNRKLWNQQQQMLQQALDHPEEHDRAIELFLHQHAMVHAAEMAQSGLWSFADEVWGDATEATIRRIPQNEEHSMAWIVWHLARIEDVTMNLLVAGSPQVLYQNDWLGQMKMTAAETGNAMDAAEITNLSNTIDLAALWNYRLAVGRRTRAIVQPLSPEALSQKVDPARLQQARLEGAVVEATRGMLDFWGKHTIAGLLLIPPTRHNFIHWNEALRIKQQRH